MARKQLDDADENLITALAPLAERLPSQIPDAERPVQAAGQGPGVSTPQRPAATPAPTQIEPTPTAGIAAPARSSPGAAIHASSTPPFLSRRVSKRSYTLPDYVEAQIHEAAYRTGLSKGAVILKALKADGFAIRDEDIRDRRKHPRST